MNILAETCNANLETGLGHLLNVYARATLSETIGGKAWYSTAHDEAARIASLYGLPIETVVKVACALSPRLDWSKNMPAAESVIRWFVAGGFTPDIRVYRRGEMKLQRTWHTPEGVAVIADDSRLPSIQGPTRVNVVKALWILQGHIDVLRGDKVSSFLDNILNHETSQLVTVDSHAIQCWFGKMEEGTYSVPPSFYAIVAADYIRAAAIVGCTPLQFQAVVWVAKKRITADNKRAAAKAKAQAKAQAKREAKAAAKLAKLQVWQVAA